MNTLFPPPPAPTTLNVCKLLFHSTLGRHLSKWMGGRKGGNNTSVMVSRRIWMGGGGKLGGYFSKSGMLYNYYYSLHLFPPSHLCGIITPCKKNPHFNYVLLLMIKHIQKTEISSQLTPRFCRFYANNIAKFLISLQSINLK